jgi:pimeloyl-ACP methyl ester carboxylesterase
MSDAAPRLGVIETEGAGPPIVLLHGFAGSAQSWDEARRGLGTDRAVLAFDLPGHGGSLSFLGFGAAPFAAKSVTQELDQRGIPEFHLAGHSMGGAVAALIAIGQPGRVLSMTLLSPGGMSGQINAPLLRAFAKAGSREELELCLTQMFAPGAVIPSMLLQSMTEMRGVPGQKEALAHIVERILRGEGQGVIPGAALEALEMPVTVVWGGEDAVMPCGVLQNLPGCFRAVLVPGAGHMLLDEAPEQAAVAISETIARAASQILPRR